MSGAAGILVVDDQQRNLTALETVLAPLGRELVTAGSGEEALRRLLDDDFAVIVMDVRMPGLDGFETVELIRNRAIDMGRERRSPAGWAAVDFSERNG